MLTQKFLKEQEENEIEKEKATQLEIMHLEISEVCLKQDQYKKICKNLDEEFVEFMKAPEQKNDNKLVIKGNGLKHKSKEKLKEIEALSNALAVLEEKRFKLN